MGIQWFTKVTSNQAKISNIKAVRKILDRYYYELHVDVAAVGNGPPGLITFCAAEEWQAGPKAVEYDLLLDEEDFNDHPLEIDGLNVRWLAAGDEVLEEHGDKGFIDLLVELAPYLDSTLVIQASSVSSFGDFEAATEWTVLPGAKEVGVKRIEAMENASA